MHQPSEPRKYQLFPQKEKASASTGRRSPESDTASAQGQAMGQNGSPEKDRSILGSALRLKGKEQTLIRRRKVSVPELGPMTTVQEIAMDSRKFSSQYQNCVVLMSFASHHTRPAASSRAINQCTRQ